jgi:hypothetical protein
MGWDATSRRLRVRAAVQLVCVVSALAFLACASAPKAAPLPRVLSVLLAPMSFNQNLPAPLDAGSSIVLEVLSGTLWKQDIQVVAPPTQEFQEVWTSQAKTTVGTLYGADGKLDRTRYDAAVRALASTYHSRGVSFDAIVIPYLAARRGSVTGQSVSWDGTSHRLPVERPNRDVTQIEVRRGLEVGCTSVLVLVYDAQGTLLFERYGGLEVAQRMQAAEGRWRWTERGDLFRNRNDLEEGVRIALQPLLEP